MFGTGAPTPRAGLIGEARSCRRIGTGVDVHHDCDPERDWCGRDSTHELGADRPLRVPKAWNAA